MTTPVIIYARLSKPGHETGSDGIATQVDGCKRYCAARGLSVAASLIDDGVSGSVPLKDRAAGEQLIACANVQKTTIVVWRFDRLFRRLSDFAVTIEQWEKVGTRVISVNENIDLTTREGRVMAAILVVFAEFERGKISDRTADAMRAKRARGEQTCPYARYGMRFINSGQVGPDGKPIFIEAVNPAEMAVIRRMRDWKRNGMTLKQIAAELNGDGIQTRRGGPWAPSTVRDVLQRRYSWKSAGDLSPSPLPAGDDSSSSVAGGPSGDPA